MSNPHPAFYLIIGTFTGLLIGLTINKNNEPPTCSDSTNVALFAERERNIQLQQRMLDERQSRLDVERSSFEERKRITREAVIPLLRRLIELGETLPLTAYDQQRLAQLREQLAQTERMQLNGH